VPPAMGFIFVTFSISQLLGGLYFIFQARALASPLVKYINHPESHPAEEQKISTFVRWLVTSSASMVVISISYIYIFLGVSYGLHRSSTPLSLFIASAFCAYSRIMISYSQAVLMSHDRNDSCCGRNEVYVLDLDWGLSGSSGRDLEGAQQDSNPEPGDREPGVSSSALSSLTLSSIVERSNESKSGESKSEDEPRSSGPEEQEEARSSTQSPGSSS